MKEQLKKGKKVYVEGRLTKRDYTDKEGIKRYSTDVVSERIIPLESSGSESGEGDSNSFSENGSASDIPQVDSNDDLPF
jgi:single-strand DNA-binding protein